MSESRLQSTSFLGVTLWDWIKIVAIIVFLIWLGKYLNQKYPTLLPGPIRNFYERTQINRDISQVQRAEAQLQKSESAVLADTQDIQAARLKLLQSQNKLAKDLSRTT